MASLTDRLTERGLISPPSHLKSNVHYEVIMGSISYGVSTDSSDVDVYGFSIPPKNMIFPHLAGEIFGFGKQIQRFEQFQQHHISDKDFAKEYDISIYNVVKYFQLCMDNNPNIIDSLFVPQRCVLHSTQIGNYVRERRKDFLHKGSWFKFKGYAYSQMHKMKNKEPEGKRKKTIEEFGFDVKFAYHVVRLLNEVEQILIEGDLDLERNREQLKSIRRGEWSIEQIQDYFTDKERNLEKVYNESKLPYSADEVNIKNILLNCLEIHYGSLKNCVEQSRNVDSLIMEINNVLTKYQRRS